MKMLLVTCPHSERVEEIALEADASGLCVRACSAFEPDWAVTCQRTCARRLDPARRDACVARVGTVLELRSCRLRSY
jgi:hypothetical protein